MSNSFPNIPGSNLYPFISPYSHCYCVASGTIPLPISISRTFFQLKKSDFLFIEDNRLLRDGLTEVLRKEPDFDVIAVPNTDTDEKLLAGFQTFDINVILLDLGLQSYDSLDVVKRIRKDDQMVNVVLMGLFATHSEVFDFVMCGVKDFFLKDATVNDFLNTIRSVAKGKNVLHAYLTESLFPEL